MANMLCRLQAYTTQCNVMFRMLLCAINQSTAALSAVCRRCRPPSSLVSGQESTICDIVWMLLQTHILFPECVRSHFFWRVPQWPCPVRKRFSNDHWRRWRWKPGDRIVRSSTSEELITVADCQSSRHRLDIEAVISAAVFPSPLMKLNFNSMYPYDKMVNSQSDTLALKTRRGF